MGRASVNQAVQIGVETTPGTQVAASKRLPGMSFGLGPRMDSKKYRAQSFKFNTQSVIHKYWSEGQLDGPLNWDEIIYPLSTLFTPPTPTTPSGGTNSREWLFKPLPQGNETLKTLTVEQGDSLAAQVATNVAAVSLGFEFASDDIMVKGDVIGRKLATGTLTGSPTDLPQQIGSARKIDVYMSDTLGALGVTLFGSGNKITDAYKESFNIGKKLSPRWVHNTDYDSFKDFVELPVELGLNFATEHNAQSRSLFDEVVNSPKKYIGIRVQGPIIEGSIRYMFEIAAATKVSGLSDEDQDGTFGYNYETSPEHDATLGSAFWIRVVNTRTAL